jgi:hypothetical protein
MCRKVGTMGDKSCFTGVATDTTKAGADCDGISVGTPGVPAVVCMSRLPVGATTEEDPVAGTCAGPTLIEPEDAGIRADPMGMAVATQAVAVATAEEAAVAWTMGTRAFCVGEVKHLLRPGVGKAIIRTLQESWALGGSRDGPRQAADGVHGAGII